MTTAAKDEFLTGAISEPLDNVSPATFCTTKCLNLRAAADDYTACNSFILEDGQCKLGFKELNWLLEQVQIYEKNGVEEVSIYLDLV